MSYSQYPSPQYHAPPQEENTAAIMGFVLSLIGVLGCVITAPIGMILSYKGMKKEHMKGLAIAGFIIGIFGTVNMVIGILILLAYLFCIGSLLAVGVTAAGAAAQQVETKVAIQEAENEITTYQIDNGRLPDGIEGNKLIVDFTDGWGNELRYELDDDVNRGYIIRSPGPDGQYNTFDDVTSEDVNRPSFDTSPPTDPFATPPTIEPGDTIESIDDAGPPDSIEFPPDIESANGVDLPGGIDDGSVPNVPGEDPFKAP